MKILNHLKLHILSNILTQLAQYIAGWLVKEGFL